MSTLIDSKANRLFAYQRSYRSLQRPRRGAGGRGGQALAKTFCWRSLNFQFVHLERHYHDLAGCKDHAAQARIARAIRKLIQIRGLQTSEQVLLEAESCSALTVRAITADCGGKLAVLGSPLHSGAGVAEAGRQCGAARRN